MKLTILMSLIIFMFSCGSSDEEKSPQEEVPVNLEQSNESSPENFNNEEDEGEESKNTAQETSSPDQKTEEKISEKPNAEDVEDVVANEASLLNGLDGEVSKNTEEEVKQPEIEAKGGDSFAQEESSSREWFLYTVQPKDTLSLIAEKFLEDKYKWKQIYEMNKVFYKSPHLIYPGDVLKVPNAPDSSVVTEQKKQIKSKEDSEIKLQITTGDTLSNIAKRYLGSANLWRHIWMQNQNGIKNPNKISLGVELTFYNYTSGAASKIYVSSNKQKEEKVIETIEDPEPFQNTATENDDVDVKEEELEDITF